MASVRKFTDIKEAAKSMKVFINIMLVVGPLTGILSAFLYRWMVQKYGQWDYSKDNFHFGIILYGLGVTLPILSISCRLMIRMFFMNCEQIENQNYLIETFKEAQEKAPELIKNIQTVVDKAVPISNNIEEIVSRAKSMAGDVEVIAHKVRSTLDGLNGALDIKVLEGHLRDVRDNLVVIAQAFGGTSSPSSGEGDLLQPGGRRRK